MADVIDRGVKLDFGGERDYNHATDSQYTNFRAKANDLYNKRNKLSQQSQEAFKHGDKKRAHDISVESKRIQEEAESYNRKAAEYVFRENNEDSAEDEIDLHGLYVKEAEWILQNRLTQAIRTNQSHLKVIVGKGLHSAHGISKLKPAIDQMCHESKLKHHIDKKNTGVLIIDLTNTNPNQIPNHWDTSISHPQQAYHGQNQPHYSQNHNNQHHNGYQQQQPIHTGNTLLDLFLKGLCICLNSK